MMSRDDMIDEIIEIERGLGFSKMEEIEEILYKWGASEDDSDPDEGYFVTMSDYDILAALEEIRRIMENNDNPRYQYRYLSSKRNLTEYEQGWVDGYEAANGDY